MSNAECQVPSYMRLPRRLTAVLFALYTSLAPRRPVTGEDLRRADMSAHPGGKGLRFTERLRDRLRRTWLRLLK